MKEEPFYISADKQKLIANATRIKILHLLKEEELTAKEVATRLGKSAGSVHYHVQLLHKGGIVDLVREQKKGGVVEKYYRARSTRFEVKHHESDGRKASGSIGTNLSLNKDEKEQFLLELEQLFVRWESQVSSRDDERDEYKVECTFEEVESE
ncbi:ArsR/SmtB family transcription factor [Rossellomorea marisflavi]|uniref:ArsR/SmtB family transcription factor n=1 Tax=Rossellomorea marisflavi TaxID=189381 RepID=UPI0034599F73